MLNSGCFKVKLLLRFVYAEAQKGLVKWNIDSRLE